MTLNDLLKQARQLEAKLNNKWNDIADFVASYRISNEEITPSLVQLGVRKSIAKKQAEYLTLPKANLV